MRELHAGPQRHLPEKRRPAGRSGSIPHPEPVEGSTQRKVPRGRDDEAGLTGDLVALAEQDGRDGYRKMGALLKAAGWLVNDKRVERIWRREGLKVPARQPKRGRIWDGKGSCLRLRAEHRDHVWSDDFVEARTHDGRKFRMLDVVDEFTRECLTIRVARQFEAADVIDVLSDLFILRGVAGHIRSDNGPEFIAKSVQAWITSVGAKDSLHRTRLAMGLGHRPPAPEVFVPASCAWPAALTRPALSAKPPVEQRPTLL